VGEPEPQGVLRVRLETRELYHSANGDRWFLVRERDSARVFIRHEPNVSSGGHTTDIDLGAFLAQGGRGPEHQELLHLIGTLVEAPPAGK
jgi:hypothetical protein